jgi:3-mercaptopyruvate sulfurtransferase SseA
VYTRQAHEAGARPDSLHTHRRGQGARDRQRGHARGTAETARCQRSRSTARSKKDLGLDSLARVELVLRLSASFAPAFRSRPRDERDAARPAALPDVERGHAPRAADTSVASLVQNEGVRAPSETQARTLTEALEYHVERQPTG